MNSFWIQILIGAVVILHSCSCEKRLIEYAPPWQPVAIPAAAPQLISIGNFDATNKAQIAQIAHHNAQILRQIKGLHPPVTQYLNPFPVYPSPNSPKHVVMTASALPAPHVPTTQHLLSSSSNVAQTVMPQTVMKSYLGSKPTYISAGKPNEFSQLKFFNGMPPSSKGPPVFLSSVSTSMPSLQIFSTTSRVPILRDVTLSSPSSIFKSTQLPQPAKFNHMAYGAGSRPAASNQIPGQIISSYTHFGPAAPQILRGEPKQRIRANFLTAPFDHYFGNPYAGHLTAGGHFVAKNNFANSLYFPHNGLGSYQLTNTFIASPQKPNSQAFVQAPQQHAPIPPPAGPPQLPDTQPSYLPQLPTVPPSVLSPFFQVQQKQQEASTTAAPHLNNQESLQNSHSNGFLLNDEYSINLVPPPPYKHTDSTRFRLRQPQASTPSTLTALAGPVTTNSTPAGPPNGDGYDDEQRKAMDILNKYNIPAISPLQDANRYAYNSGPFAHTSTTAPTPSYSDDQIFQRWPPNDNGLLNSPTFTTEKPNIFRNLNRPLESEYHQHKLMHPNYTGARRPLAPATTPFLPTADSLNNAITHSFFTIEDAITISPHSHYRRPVKPTNTNEIEASIKRPTNDIYTESASIDPFSDYDGNRDGEADGGDIVTVPPPPPPPPSTSTFRPRQKLRRKRPRPTTESTSTVDNERNQFKFDFDEREPNNEVITEMPKNHKEYTATRDRGQLVQFTQTTTDSPRESSTGGYRNSNRVRNRTRISNTAYESSTSAPSLRPKRPNYSPENRRPNNRFEDNKVQRQRPQAEKSTRLPIEENEPTTIGQREIFNRPSRRPLTTQPAIPTTLQDDTDANDFFLDSKLTYRFRNSSPTSVITTSLLTPTIDSGRLEENSVVLSTRLNAINEPLSTNEPEDTTNGGDDESATSEPHTQESIPALSSPSSSLSSSSSSSSSSISTSTSTASSSSTSSEKNEASRESMSTSDGPVYIRDESKLEMSNFRTRQRMRNKEKILEAVAAATSSQSKSVTKDRGHGFAHHNEVNDIENEPTSTEKENSRLRVRLPVYKAGSKISGEEAQFSNVTKAIRVNGTNKFDPKNRPRFSIKEYRQRMSSTTPTPDQSSSNNIVSTTASYTRLRFPTRQRVLPSELKNKTLESNKIDEKPNIIYPEKSTAEPSSTESGVLETTRKRFVPKDRYSSRLKTTTETIIIDGQTIATPTTASVTTAKPPIRRVSTRRDSITNRTRTSSTTTDSTSEVSSTVSRIPVIRNGTVPLRRPQPPSLRQRIQNKKNKENISSTTSTDESLNDLAVEGSSEDKVRLSSNEVAPSTSTEEYKHETAIMKIAKDDHSYRPYKEKATTEKSKTESSSSENDLNDSPSEQSERVAELTIFGSNQFNSVNTGSASRRIPGYFTLATEDPILPIEAFFPQVKRNK